MSSANSTAKYMQAMKLKISLKNTLNHDTRTDDEENNNDEGNNEEIPMIIDEEIETAFNKLKKGKASDNKGIRAEVIKLIFNEALKQESCTPETWRRIRIKVIHKKEMWKKLVTTARFVHCQRCTNCFRPSCTTDFILGLIKSNQESMEGSVVLTKRKIQGFLSVNLWGQVITVRGQILVSRIDDATLRVLCCALCVESLFWRAPRPQVNTRGFSACHTKPHHTHTPRPQQQPRRQGQRETERETERDRETQRETVRDREVKTERETRQDERREEKRQEPREQKR